MQHIIETFFKIIHKETKEVSVKGDQKERCKTYQKSNRLIGSFFA